MGFYLAERWPSLSMWEDVCRFVRRVPMTDVQKGGVVLEWAEQVGGKVTVEMIEAATGRKAGNI